MTRLQQVNKTMFNSFFQNTTKSNTKAFKAKPIQLSFLNTNAELKPGSVNLFCGYKGCGFGQFINTLALETDKQNVNTLLISDVILKSFIGKNLMRAQANVNQNQYLIKEGLKINSSQYFEESIEQLILKNNPKLIVVYPFFMPEGHCKAVLRILKCLSKKHKLAVVVNIPIEDYVIDQKTLLYSSCEEALLKLLDINLVFSTRPNGLRNNLQSKDLVVLQTRCLKTGLSWDAVLKLNHKRQIFVNTIHNAGKQ